MELMFGIEMRDVFERFIASQPLSPEVYLVMNRERGYPSEWVGVVTGPSKYNSDYFVAQFDNLANDQCFVLGIAWAKWVANNHINI